MKIYTQIIKVILILVPPIGVVRSSTTQPRISPASAMAMGMPASPIRPTTPTMCVLFGLSRPEPVEGLTPHNSTCKKLSVQCLNGAHLGSARCALSESSGVERHKSFVLRIKFSAGRQFCASKSPTSCSCKTLSATLKPDSATINRQT